MALKSTICGMCITHAGPKLTAQRWFRVLNFYQEQSAYAGFFLRAGHIEREKAKTCEVSSDALLL